jgi:hypothetical protein
MMRVIYPKYCKIVEDFLNSDHYPECHGVRMNCFMNDSRGVHYKCLKCKRIKVTGQVYEIYYDSKGVVQIKAIYENNDRKRIKLTNFIPK